MNPSSPNINIIKHLDGRRATKHVQIATSRHGVVVDVGMKPLIEALWARGFDTQFSCQDAQRWGAPSGRASIVFTRFSTAVTFVRCSSAWLVDELNWTDPRDNFCLMPGKPMKGSGWRAFVHFPTWTIDRLAQLWSDDEP